jgi:ankyrin repeat protein
MLNNQKIINLNYDNYYQEPYRYKYKKNNNNNLNDIMNLLLNDINSILENDKVFNPILFKLIANNNFKEFLKTIENKNININEQDKDGDTPLHIAVFLGNCKFIKVLLNLDLNIFLTDKWGQIALHRLCFCLNDKRIIEVVDLFINYNKKNNYDLFNLQDSFGNTVFHLILKHIQKNNIQLEDYHYKLIKKLKLNTNLNLKNIDNNNIHDLLKLINY